MSRFLKWKIWVVIVSRCLMIGTIEVFSSLEVWAKTDVSPPNPTPLMSPSPTSPSPSPSSSLAKTTGESVALLPGSTLQLFGDSTLRKFSSTANQILVTGRIESDPTAPKDGLKVKVGDFSITLPIAAMKSGDTKLDEHLSEALKADKFPEIRGVLKTYEVKGKNEDGSYPVNASIDLTVAGVTKRMPVQATVTHQGDQVRVKGEKQFLMTDFKVDPPTLMLGVIRTADEIAIHFDLILGLKRNTNKG